MKLSKMNIKQLILVTSLCIVSQFTYSQDSIRVTISSTIMSWGDTDEWLHLRITDTLTNNIWYDSLWTVSLSNGFNDTVYLDSGSYKCEVLDMGAMVNMPNIILDNGDTAVYGYPNYEYYLFSLPGDNQNTYSYRTVTSCDNYVSPSTNYTWSNSGVYTDIIKNSMGSDSIITIDLTVVTIDNTITTGTQNLVSNELGAQYQWLACNSGSIIVGANDQSYQPIVNGLYSVHITKDGCEKTSDCYSFVLSNIDTPWNTENVSIYPNPTKDLISFELKSNVNSTSIDITDISGKRLLKYDIQNQDFVQIDISDFVPGIYFALLHSEGADHKIKIVKN